MRLEEYQEAAARSVICHSHSFEEWSQQGQHHLDMMESLCKKVFARDYDSKLSQK